MTVTAEQLRRTTADYLTARPDRASYLAPVFALLDRGVDLTPRNQWLGHATASAVVLDPEQRVLFIAHVASGKWLASPGGHLEDVDDTLEQAVARELAEELGLVPADVVWLLERPVHVDLYQVPARQTRGEPSHLHIDYCYLVQTHRDDFDLQTQEIAGTHWRPVTAIRNPDLRAAVQTALATRAGAVPTAER